VYSRDSDGVDRLLGALEALGLITARPDHKLKSDASHLTFGGHQLLTTRFGLSTSWGASGGPAM
jgi:hypothetical protein